MTLQNKPLRYLLIDTCIFDHIANSELSVQIFAIAGDAINKGYALSLSLFSIFEMVNTSTVENELKAMAAIQGMKRFKINQSVLLAAGRLGEFYKREGSDKEPEDGDKIIAATAVIYNCVIFTTNGRDFPQPFFNVIAKPILTYTSKGKEIMLPAYLIEPDINVITRKIQERKDEEDQFVRNLERLKPKSS